MTQEVETHSSQQQGAKDRNQTACSGVEKKEEQKGGADGIERRARRQPTTQKVFHVRCIAPNRRWNIYVTSAGVK